MKSSRIGLALVLGLIALFLLSGCITFGSSSKKPRPPRYYDFNDIQVPGRMSLDKDRSLVFQAAGFKAGVLTVYGRVKSGSLVNFVLDAMSKDNWTLKVQHKYPRIVMMFFKPGRTCVWSIKEGTWSTTAEIWVVPSR